MGKTQPGRRPANATPLACEAMPPGEFYRIRTRWRQAVDAFRVGQR